MDADDLEDPPPDLEGALRDLVADADWEVAEWSDQDFDSEYVSEAWGDREVDSGDSNAPISLTFRIAWRGALDEWDDPDPDDGSWYSGRGVVSLPFGGHLVSAETAPGLDVLGDEIGAGLVERLDASLRGVVDAYDGIDGAVPAFDPEGSILGEVAGVASELSARYGGDPSRKGDKELAERLAGFLDGREVEMSRTGIGDVNASPTGRSFRESVVDGDD